MKKLASFALLFMILIGVISVTIIFNSAYALMSYHIPRWMKVIAGWYITGQISDSEFTQVVQYLVNQGIIKVQSNDATITNSTIVGIIVNHLEVQNMTQQKRITLNNTLETAPTNQTSSVSNPSQSTPNPSQSTPNPSTNSASLDPKKLSLDWYNGKITDQQFVDQIQALINSGQIAPYTESSREALTTKPTPQTNVPEQIPSLGYITQADKHDLLRQANAGIINSGYLRYWFSEMCAAGSITGDCLTIFQELGSHTMYTPRSGPNNIPTDNATVIREKEIVTQWAANNMTSQDFINQILPFFYNGTIVYPAQDFKTVKVPTQPIPDFVKMAAGNWASGSIPDDQWQHTVLGELYYLGYLHNP